jgi:hypothetical protein
MVPYRVKKKLADRICYYCEKEFQYPCRLKRHQKNGQCPASVQPVEEQYMSSVQPVEEQYMSSVQPVEEQYMSSVQPVDEQCMAKISKIKLE